MKKYIIVPAIAVSGIAGLIIAASAQGVPLPTATGTGSPTPSPSPTLSVSPSPEPEPESGEVTADIYFEFNYAVDAPDAPLYSEIIGVPVSGEVELPAQDRYWGEGEGDYCTAPSVDIAADLSSVTVTGADDECSVQVAYLEITLHGAEFGTVTLGADGLFNPYDFPIPPAKLKGGGKGGLAYAVPFEAPDEELPTLQGYGASGSEFEAYWEGTGQGVMSGVTEFAFAVDADGAEPVPGEPTFTG